MRLKKNWVLAAKMAGGAIAVAGACAIGHGTASADTTAPPSQNLSASQSTSTNQNSVVNSAGGSAAIAGAGAPSSHGGSLSSPVSESTSQAAEPSGAELDATQHVSSSSQSSRPEGSPPPAVSTDTSLLVSNSTPATVPSFEVASSSSGPSSASPSLPSQPVVTTPARASTQDASLPSVATSPPVSQTLNPRALSEPTSAAPKDVARQAVTVDSSGGTRNVLIDDAYLAPFLAADPNQRFAYTRYLVGLRGTTQTYTLQAEAEYQQFLSAQDAVSGHVNFTRTPSGALRYTNTSKDDVLVIYGDRADSVARGALLVRAGQSVTLPLPPTAATAGAMSATTGLPTSTAYLAVAYPGLDLPISGTPAPQTSVIARVVQFVQQAVRNTVESIVRTIARSVAPPQSSAPSSTAGLYDRIRNNIKDDNGDRILIDRVQAADGTRYIVYLGGTVPQNFLSDFSNAPAWIGLTKPGQIAAIRRAIGDDRTAKIMLVGYSQGGMDAQNIAASHNFNVTTVVTFGAPIIDYPPKDYKIIHLRAFGDPVTGLGKRLPDLANNLSGNVFTSFTTTFSLLNPLSSVHGTQATYEQVGRSFDSSSGYSEMKYYMSRFRGASTRIV